MQALTVMHVVFVSFLMSARQEGNDRYGRVACVVVFSL